MINRWCFLSLLLLVSVANAEVYKCTSLSGKIGYSDKPCADTSNSEKVEINTTSFVRESESTLKSGVANELRSGILIRKIIDNNTVAINKEYFNRLRSNPNLEGKLALFISIPPSGKNSGCESASQSTLVDDDFETTVCNIVSAIDFGQIDAVENQKILYTFNFVSVANEEFEKKLEQ